MPIKTRLKKRNITRIGIDIGRDHTIRERERERTKGEEINESIVIKRNRKASTLIAVSLNHHQSGNFPLLIIDVNTILTERINGGKVLRFIPSPARRFIDKLGDLGEDSYL